MGINKGIIIFYTEIEKLLLEITAYVGKERGEEIFEEAKAKAITSPYKDIVTILYKEKMKIL